VFVAAWIFGWREMAMSGHVLMISLVPTPSSFSYVCTLDICFDRDHRLMAGFFCTAFIRLASSFHLKNFCKKKR
jgi:hypothetical protein